EAIEGDNILSRELKDYISRLQEKLAKVRSLGGSYSQIDLSPYIKEVQSRELEQTETVIESRQRAGIGKAARSI
ncbi:MAG: hypothetical protein JW745_05625, partial [Sedimentisphaerales bacterium]|nr:hypothetical protein [Sedimentisphaerales bacterium]